MLLSGLYTTQEIVCSCGINCLLFQSNSATVLLDDIPGCTHFWNCDFTNYVTICVTKIAVNEKYTCHIP